MTQTPPRNHWHIDPTCGHQRYQGYRDLVTYTPGGVLVDLGSGDIGEIHHLAGMEHCLGPGGKFLVVHPVQQDRHRHCGHLVVRHAAIGICADEPFDGVRRENTPIAFGLDQIDYRMRHGHKLFAFRGSRRTPVGRRRG